MSQTPRYYHGGVCGLAVGDLLLPASETQVKDRTHAKRAPAQATPELVDLLDVVGRLTRDDRVYFAAREIDAEVC